MIRRECKVCILIAYFLFFFGVEFFFFLFLRYFQKNLCFILSIQSYNTNYLGYKKCRQHFYSFFIIHLHKRQNCIIFYRVSVILISWVKYLLLLELQSHHNGLTWFTFLIMLNINMSLLLHSVRYFPWQVIMHWIYCQKCSHMTRNLEFLHNKH